MKNIINYFYNLYPDSISKMYGGFYFENKNIKYLLIELFVEPTQLLEIYEKLMSLNIHNYILIYNKDNLVVTNHNNKHYVLFVINCNPNEIIRFDEQFNIQINNKINWSKLWSDRIDYYEIQINELAQGKNIVLHSVNYYIGLAENAIVIADKYEEMVNVECGIQHYRMHAPVIKGEYFNPSNMLIDVKIRDVAEYIKSSFFIEKRDINHYIDYIKNIYLNEITANLLFARLLYPSYYFDIFDDIILNDHPESELLPIMEFQIDYEIFLKTIYNTLLQNYQLININWLKKGL